ncbi:MAG: hypothetical protein KGK44_11510 [Gammaproteobacteria bacterium]|nr:hypothetical protein [Gammaproteobacteria bacterium]
MRQLIRFSSAPHQTRWFDSLLTPVITLSNLMMAAWLYPVWGTTRTRWGSDKAELIRLFRERTRPIICLAWHASELLAVCAFRRFPRDVMPMVIGHDGFSSLAVQQTAANYGYPLWVYRRRSPVTAKTQIIELLKSERPVVGLYPDAGGPDGQIRPGMLETARAAGALLVPMAWHARPVLVVGWRRRFYLPLPYSRITFYYGRPLDGATATADECRQALDNLQQHAREAG